MNRAQEDFAEGRFKIECGQLVLTSFDKDLAIKGPGEIWQDEEGVLQYKIFADETALWALYKHTTKLKTPGQILPEEHYFSLEAQEFSGEIWTTDHVLPGHRGGASGGLALGHLYDLKQKRACPNNDNSAVVMCRFPGKLDFPRNKMTETVTTVGGQKRHSSHSLNAAFIDEGDHKFQILQEKEHTSVSLQLPLAQLDAATPSRITETLQFVLGQQLPLMVVETIAADQDETILVSRSRGEGELLPPLNLKRGERTDVWRMFMNYFCYVQPNPTLGWHPISRHVASVIESTAASLETQILALSVAVEGLAAESFADLASVSPDFIKDLDRIEAEIDNMKLSDENGGRIRGSIRAMRRPRNSDIIRTFIEKHNLPIGLFDSWNRLRQAAAHGAGGGGRDFEAILKLKGEVLSLFYSLVFATIGYSGPRSDYGLPGWPIRAWPVELAP
ncbi:MAG TPA: hypothetical protein VGI85_14760 [Chthoniobacterales bacterium]|jgi:hypothetical protein